MIPNNIIKILKESERIAILPHVSADGDALGSSTALALALRGLKKQVVVYIEEDIPFIYSFLPGKELIRLYDSVSEQYDVVVALDTGDLERLGKRVDIFKKAPVTVNVDHHNTNTEFAFHNYVNLSSSAVGEIIYQLLKMMDVKMDKDISTCLYVAITTDTGGFRYSNTTPVTHQIAGELIQSGVNVAEVSQRVFETTSLGKVKLMGAATNSLEVLENGRVAFISLTDEMIRNCGAKEEDCDGIVNLGRNIDGVEVAVMFRQRLSGEIKVNFRSKTYVDVSAIANMYKGGGHKRAAGCTVQGDLEQVKRRVLEDIKEVLIR